MVRPAIDNPWISHHSALGIRTGVILATCTALLVVNNHSKPQVKNFVRSRFGNYSDYQ